MRLSKIVIIFSSITTLLPQNVFEAGIGIRAPGAELREANQRAQEADERAEDERRIRQEAESRAQIEGKKTYVPAIHFSRNHFLSRQTRVSVHRVPSPAPKTSPARPC